MMGFLPANLRHLGVTFYLTEKENNATELDFSFLFLG
jgi:hypothetical protein